MTKHVVAIVGRPNVGKSTFFNRCVGAKHAIVDDQPGVTRDRIYRETEWCGQEFVLVDTGGILTESTDEITTQVYDQARLAVTEADLIVFMVDGKAGLNGADEDVANLLRRSKKPIIVAVNKIDDPKDEPNVLEFYQLGLGDPMPVSAMRGSGDVGDVLDKIVALINPEREVPKKNGKVKKSKTARLADAETAEIQAKEEEARLAEIQSKIAIAIVGKPNVGKSSIVNAMIGEKRSIVTNVPGTTRDAIDSTIIYKGRELTLVDTAGIRRKSKVDYGIEAFSVVRSLRAISRSEVVVFVMDATQEISDQDQKIGAKIDEAGRACVVVVNKWDLIDNKTSKLMNEFTEKVKSDLRMLAFAPVVFTSAETKQRLTKILDVAEAAYAETQRRISTGLVPPPSGKRGKRLKVYYGTQVSVGPPTFILFVNDSKLLTNSYKVYLERKLREAFGFVGTPIRIATRDKKEK
ncbi:MAG TPA: ribosome biogenesis GTPase Der [Candidatus Melainabacteria bacterium]|nr:ribosome biogenesis GTPase Der [Candidatus Melainabacteria bacterium]